tara:strand:+ start:1100 stop:1333 length:234 start_codon:yes stop_codon:yes gene_type:complete
MIFESWDDFLKIVSYWQLDLDFSKVKGYNDRHKISRALQLIRADYYEDESMSMLFNHWLEAKVNDTRDMIEYYKVNK